ncbi:MAG: ABC transporter ATP-binding protein [Halobacteriales archaeon]
MSSDAGVRTVDDTTTDREVILSVRDLKKYFPITGGLLSRKQGEVKAVNGMSFDIYRGETLGIAGESGCGKSTTAKMLLRLIEPTAGTIEYRDQNILELSKSDLRDLREDIGVVYQDPFSSLNPRMSVRKIIAEPLHTHRNWSEEERNDRVGELLERVGLSVDHMYRYPHEFSGGQRQRIAIARALALEPSFVILDEPTSALDVSVQAKILNLLEELQDELDLTYLFITHDLNVMRHIADRLIIMYLGQIMERGPTDALFEDAHHPYTETLLEAIPQVGRRQDTTLLEGDVPSPRNPPSGCVFHTRCPYAVDACAEEVPSLHRLTGEANDRHRRESHCLFEDPTVEPPERF